MEYIFDYFVGYIQFIEKPCTGSYFITCKILSTCNKKINTVWPNFPFIYHLKTSENQRYIGILGENRLSLRKQLYTGHAEKMYPLEKTSRQIFLQIFNLVGAE